MLEPISLTELERRVGSAIGTSDWLTVSQDMIDRFADATGDHQFIHVDAARAQTETPFGGTIAHGFLTLSLLSQLGQQVRPPLAGTAMSINYGLDKLRFINPVRCGARVRAEFTLLDVSRRQSQQVLARYQVSVAIEGEDKPALVADWLNLIVLNDDAPAAKPGPT